MADTEKTNDTPVKAPAKPIGRKTASDAAKAKEKPTKKEEKNAPAKPKANTKETKKK